ncbi:MAG: amidophosphoribosyltransferase, partial [Candidatus Latescibacteria bacterium 4484_181]
MGDCGLFGIYGHKNAADLAYLGLYSLQHRGQESAGIVVGDHKTLRQHKGLGLVTDVFSDPATLKDLAGDLAVGHTRYSTTGSPLPANIQPLLVNCKGGPLAIAHNGNLVNSNALRHKLEQEGSLFQTTVDSEVIIHLTARSQREVLLQRMIEALRQVRGAYSILAITKDKIIAVRDPHGFRPLCLGKLGDAWVVASESCALDIIGGKYCRDVEPGEIVILSEDGLSSIKPFGSHRYAFCIFEYIYFSRPDSKVFGENVDKARRRLGRQLAVEHP